MIGHIAFNRAPLESGVMLSGHLYVQIMSTSTGVAAGQLVSRRALQELVKQIDPNERLTPEVEEVCECCFLLIAINDFFHLHCQLLPSVIELVWPVYVGIRASNSCLPHLGFNNIIYYFSRKYI